jgi:SAM-dependent methyltransferase
MLYEDRDRATSFGSDPEKYHRSRPSYPAAMIDHLMQDHPQDVLDVGCGTGITSGLFRDRGCRVLGVEIDERMAAYARELGFHVEIAGFEQWQPEGRSFDLVISGQAWHWVEPIRGAHKAADALRSGGRVGLFWNRACHPPEVQSGFDSVYRALAPGLEGYSIVLGQGTGDRFTVAAEGLGSTGRFGPPEELRFQWKTTYTKDRWLDHLLTHSDHRALPPAERDQLLRAVGEVIDGFGGSFATEYDVVLITAVRL